MTTLNILRFWWGRGGGKQELRAGLSGVVSTSLVWAFLLLTTGAVHGVASELNENLGAISANRKPPTLHWLSSPYIPALTESALAHYPSQITRVHMVVEAYYFLLFVGASFVYVPLAMLWITRCRLEPLRTLNLRRALRFLGASPTQLVLLNLFITLAYTLVGMIAGTLLYFPLVLLCGKFSLLGQALTPARILPPWPLAFFCAASFLLFTALISAYLGRYFSYTRLEDTFVSTYRPRAYAGETLLGSLFSWRLCGRFPVAPWIGLTALLLAGLGVGLGVWAPAGARRQEPLVAILLVPLLVLILTGGFFAFTYFFLFVLPTWTIRLSGWLISRVRRPGFLLAGRMVQASAHRYWIMLFPLTVILQLYWILFTFTYMRLSVERDSNWQAFTSWRELAQTPLFDDIHTGFFIVTVLLSVTLGASALMDAKLIHRTQQRARTLRTLWALGFSPRALFSLDLAALGIAIGTVLLVALGNLGNFWVFLSPASPPARENPRPLWLQASLGELARPEFWVLPALGIASVWGYVAVSSYRQTKRALQGVGYVAEKHEAAGETLI